MGTKTIQVWRRVATQWEDAMSYDFPFLFYLLITRRHPSLLFWSLFLLVIFIWTDLLVLMDFHLIWRWVTESGNPVGIKSFSNGFCLFSHFIDPRVMRPFGLPLSFLHKSLPLRLSFLYHQKGVNIISLIFIRCIFKSVFIYLISPFS